MARRVSEALFAELEWENLLGLDKETREIKDLCSRRQASHYVALNDAYGLRVAGLVSTLTESSDEIRYSLAAILAHRAAGQPLLFLYALGGENDQGDQIIEIDQVIVIAIHGGKPTLDRILPKKEALQEATLFAETQESTVRLVGNLSVPGIDLTLMSLPGPDMLAEQERIVARIHALTGNSGSNIAKMLAFVFILAGSMGAMAWMLWPAARYTPPPPASIDTQDAYYAKLQLAREAALAKPADPRIGDIQALLSVLPIELHGWRVTELKCTSQQCRILWTRGGGATFEALQRERPEATLQDDNYDQAIEHHALIAVHDAAPSLAAPTPPGPFAKLIILPRLHFYEIAKGRTATLTANGMKADIGEASPLIPLPSGMGLAQNTSGSASRPLITAKGEWQLSGHLAFVDSVAGLLHRTGNMHLNTIDIHTDPEHPRFTASGDFYVE